MTLIQDIFFAVVAEAKAKAAGNRRWLSAIEKAVDGLLSEKWIVTELQNCVMITTESGETYRANGVCQCKAFFANQPCKHRAAAQLIKRYNEKTATPATSRESLIESIKSNWPADVNLADELMRRFKRNRLEMLSTDFLQAIHAIL
jgi:hypothetical protein